MKLNKKQETKLINLLKNKYFLLYTLCIMLLSIGSNELSNYLSASEINIICYSISCFFISGLGLIYLCFKYAKEEKKQ